MGSREVGRRGCVRVDIKRNPADVGALPTLLLSFLCGSGCGTFQSFPQRLSLPPVGLPGSLDVRHDQRCACGLRDGDGFLQRVLHPPGLVSHVCGIHTTGISDGTGECHHFLCGRRTPRGVVEARGEAEDVSVVDCVLDEGDHGFGFILRRWA